MKIPRGYEQKRNLVKELVDACLISRESRRVQARQWRQLFYTGSMSGMPSKHNRCFSHVDKLGSFLFSPSEVRFTVEFDGDGQPEWSDKADRASGYLNRRFNRRGCGAAFAQANELALVEGSAFVKLTWKPGKGLEPWVIRQSFMGVLREDIEELDRQEAFVHSFYVTKDVFRRMVWNHPDKADLMTVLTAVQGTVAAEDLVGDSYFHEMIIGNTINVPGSNNAPASYGQVAITSPVVPQLAPEVAADLVRIDDLWVWNDDQEDWNTIRWIDTPGVMIEGRYQLRSLSDAPKRHPFVKVCSNPMHGYFWGRSELATVFEAQMLLNKRVDDVDRIFSLQSRPPRAFSGFQSLTEEKAKALLSPGATITEGAIGAKVDTLAPEMPSEALPYLDKLESYFDEAGGFTNILSGQGEPGVRAGVHAGVLLRTSTPRLRDRALTVERQCGEFGSLCFDVCRAKDATVLVTRKGDQQFTLEQLPRDAEASVDSHTSSPAFSEDIRQMANDMVKAGIIDGETYIQMVHPPREDVVMERYRQRMEAQAKWEAEHPEEAAEQKRKR